jgi:hypothetical protein
MDNHERMSVGPPNEERKGLANGGFKVDPNAKELLGFTTSANEYQTGWKTSVSIAGVPLVVVPKVIPWPDLEGPFEAVRGGGDAKAKATSGPVQVFADGCDIGTLKSDFGESGPDDAVSIVIPDTRVDGCRWKREGGAPRGRKAMRGGVGKKWRRWVGH